MEEIKAQEKTRFNPNKDNKEYFSHDELTKFFKKDNKSVSNHSEEVLKALKSAEELYPSRQSEIWPKLYRLLADAQYPEIIARKINIDKPSPILHDPSEAQLQAYSSEMEEYKRKQAILDAQNAARDAQARAQRPSTTLAD